MEQEKIETTTTEVENNETETSYNYKDYKKKKIFESGSAFNHFKTILIYCFFFAIFLLIAYLIISI